jgi:hypothetical protein
MEKQRGEALAQRQVVFFVVFLVLALLSFNLLKRIFVDPS